MSALADQSVLDSVLDLLASKLDGKPAAANTIGRRRSVLYTMLSHGVDDGLFEVNPLDRSRWTAPDAVQTVDPGVVINPDQARALLAAVTRRHEAGQHLMAFFGCLYYSALRPSEAVPLTDTAIQLPDEGWGEFRLRESAPLSGARWSDSGRSRDRRQLKHRPQGDVRVVPIPPPLTSLLHRHLEEFGTGPDGRLFRAPRGGLLGDKFYGDI